MRILVINGNTDEGVTRRIHAAAQQAAPEIARIETITAPFGLPLIVTRADWLAAGPAMLAALAEHEGRFDAAVIACFGDPGVEAARDVFAAPVIGISEAAFHAAAMLGRRFGVVGFTRALQPMFEDCLERVGLAGRCAGFRMGGAFAGDPATVAEEARDALLQRCRESVEQDGAEAVILAGGPLAGLAPLLQPELPVPLLDGTAAGVRMAAALVGLAPAPRPRRRRALTGYDERLRALYSGRS
jgi:Asp/Glu/hydantoin racemase